MTRFTALIISVAILISSTLFLTSCADEPTTAPTPEHTDGATDKTAEEIVTPAPKEYSDRNTVKFNEIVYSRPDMAALTDAFSAVADDISSTELTFDEKIGRLESVEDDYSHMLTMLSYSNVKKDADVSDEYWASEHAYISEAYPAFSAALEAVFVAAAQSPDAERFENEYFGDGLIEKYAGGGSITEKLVELAEKEARLENEYSTISGANTVITYKGMTDTYDNVIESCKERLGAESAAYKTALDECDRLYAKAVSEKTRNIFVELLKVRRDIADEYGYGSYAEHAYKAIYHDYSESKMLRYIEDIATCIIPVWAALEAYVFSGYEPSFESTVDKTELINTLYSVYEDMDAELHDAYSFMLQFELYDINAESENRFAGSFETYLYDCDAPFVFVSTGGGAEDFMTLSHEFGHFADDFFNRGGSTSLDLSEISSTALEFLTFLRLDEALGTDMTDMHFLKIREALRTLVFQGFYALFEHYAYAIPENEISEEAVKGAMLKAATDMNLNADAFTVNFESGIYHELDYVLIPHLLLYPCYVESYCTSVAVSLEIYFLEKQTEGAGLTAYLDLIKREDTPLEFEDYIEESGLTSPFEKGFLEELAYKIYYDILGDYRFNENTRQSQKYSAQVAMPAA